MLFAPFVKLPPSYRFSSHLLWFLWFIENSITLYLAHTTPHSTAPHRTVNCITLPYFSDFFLPIPEFSETENSFVFVFAFIVFSGFVGILIYAGKLYDAIKHSFIRLVESQQRQTFYDGRLISECIQLEYIYNNDGNMPSYLQSRLPL